MADKASEVFAADDEPKLAIFENKAILLGIIVIVQAVVAIGLTQFVILPKVGLQGADMTKNSAAKEMEAAMPEVGVLLGLEEIIVTLAGDAQRPRYVRLSVSVELKDRLTADVAANRLPQLRDIVIMALSEKTAEELSRPKGKQDLRDELFRRIDAKMPAGTLMNVYFSDLVLQ